MTMMRAARLHEIGHNFTIDEVERPSPGPRDVVVAVKACNMIPNLKNVISVYPEKNPFLPLPELPAIFGLGAAGVVAEVGSQVGNVQVGDRVYVNPGRHSGDSHASRIGEPVNDPAFTFQGYFGFGPGSARLFRDYPHGGLCEYMKAPADGLIVLPANVTFEQASRFGYLGTAYAGLRKAGVRAGQTVLINGATGTLGVSTVLNALAMGATRILALGRKTELLERLRQLDPDRVRVMRVGDHDVQDWAREETDGLGPHVFVDAVSATSPAQLTLDCLDSLRRGGRMVSIGAMEAPLPLEMYRLMTANITIIGSLWFDVSDGEDMAAMASAGTLDLTAFDQTVFPLEKANDALEEAALRTGGFANVVVSPGI
ncbi:zinc-binding dehydrogenase [Rhodococcus sp. ZPP]|uniref:alcohol dehydrogenase catalytic domain-containing protein n=1 Tax=Rhodococcus sp. ZPP TaxID=2749906 RepID=UPI001BB4B41A|nr:zinc-binding dehydrogenase [Rhodococcus sp. ZPP]QTJ66866.1 zinc-binding dehydrogenase [Rhodococcus sp. ZPP]